MLNQNDYISAPPESGFAHWLYPKYKNWTERDIYNQGIQSFLNDLYNSKKFETWSLPKDQLLNHLVKAKPSKYSELIAEIYVFYKLMAGKSAKIVVDKNNYYIQHLDDLPNIWPDSNYIHLIRDVRDVVCSYLDVTKLKTNSPYKPNFSNKIPEITKEWCRNINLITNFSQSVSENFLIIHYENLILNTETILKEICDFLECPFQEKMKTYFTEKSIYLTEPEATLDWKKRTLTKPDSSRIGRYHHFLTQEQQQKINSIAGLELKRYNYI